jgi:hypothetical protein
MSIAIFQDFLYIALELTLLFLGISIVIQIYSL